MAEGRTLLIGIDIGTTAVKGTLIDTEGHLLAEASHAHDLFSKEIGWAEEDPADWWQGTLSVLRELAGRQREFGGTAAALSTSGMVPALLLLDGAGTPLRLSIQQNDGRCHAEIADLKERLDEKQFFTLTGGSLNQQTIPPRTLWLRRHEPETWGRLSWVLGSYDYVTYRLTGRLTLERNWALESGMYDVRREDWVDHLLAAAGLTRANLPPVVRPGEVVGTLAQPVAEAVGLSPRTVVAAGSADHVASAFSAGVREEGDVLLKFGGAGDILMASDTLRYDRRLFLDYHLIPGKYLVNGCMAASGSLVKWFVTNFTGGDGEAKGNPYAALDRLASQLPPGADGLVILPYFLGEKTPIMDATARGLFFGLSLHHRAEHLYRAILEAVGYGFYHHLEVMAEMGLTGRRYFMSNGGSRSVVWRQIVTDIVGAPVEYIVKHPGSSLGAAFLAGMAIGAFRSWDEVGRYSAERERVTPDPARHRVYREYFKLYKELYERLKPAYATLNDLVTGGRADVHPA
ncbi:MAG: FGGY-family carbohydrate kinase [Bacillota bacterium]|nr:FGGY-family carbohydrate kinase [Bacillota bacterium]